MRGNISRKIGEFAKGKWFLRQKYDGSLKMNCFVCNFITAGDFIIFWLKYSKFCEKLSEIREINRFSLLLKFKIREGQQCPCMEQKFYRKATLI